MDSGGNCTVVPTSKNACGVFVCPVWASRVLTTDNVTEISLTDSASRLQQTVCVRLKFQEVLSTKKSMKSISFGGSTKKEEVCRNELHVLAAACRGRKRDAKSPC